MHKKLSWICRIFQRYSSNRHKPFEIIGSVQKQTFVRMGPKKIVMIDEDRVINLAHQLEAVVVMSEMMEGEHPVAVAVTNLELAHFVAYVRQLDHLYRRQANKIIRLEREIKDADARKPNPEFK